MANKKLLTLAIATALLASNCLVGMNEKKTPKETGENNSIATTLTEILNTFKDNLKKTEVTKIAPCFEDIAVAYALLLYGDHNAEEINNIFGRVGLALKGIKKFAKEKQCHVQKVNELVQKLHVKITYDYIIHMAERSEIKGTLLRLYRELTKAHREEQKDPEKMKKLEKEIEKKEKTLQPQKLPKEASTENND